MKKILSLLLVGIMVVSMIPTAFATTDVSNGTQVSYNAEADNDGDGQPDHAEAWTVTVPAQLAPGASGNVVAQGTWASNRKLTVTADTSVELTNSINSADKKDLAVTFPGIELAGSNTAAVTDTKAVSVAGIDNALFGTWSGTFYYNVEMTGAVIKTLTITEEGEHFVSTIQYEEGMTWAEWAESKYNVPIDYRSDEWGENSFTLDGESNCLIFGSYLLTLSEGDPNGDFRQDIAGDVIDSSKTYFLTL